MMIRLIKFNAWFALACGVFCLMVAPLIVDNAVVSMGARADGIIPNETYLAAVTFVRIVGILLFAYSLIVRLVIRQHFDPENLKSVFALWSVGLLVWGGMFLFVLFTKSAALASACGVGLLEWLAIPAVMLFTYKNTENWQAAPRKDNDASG
jgi:hypothetical protein